MKYLRELLVCGLVAAAAAPVWAGHVTLQPSGFAAIRAGATEPIYAGAITFDLSQLPDSARIDLAELHVQLDIDTLLGADAEVFAGVATESWSSTTVGRTTPIATSDSLFVDGYSTTGGAATFEADVTYLVNLWHKGRLPNYGLVLQSPGNTARQMKVAGLPTGVTCTLEIFFTN